jgi:hypothetical protein
MINKNKIDSLRLLVPFNEVTINPNHSEFLRELTTINSDGEIINSKINNTYRLHSNPCSSTYLKANTIIQGENVQVLKIGFSSKILESNYFDGITLENIDQVLKFINSENVIKIKKSTLLNARVVDVDICKDILLKDATVKELIKYTRELAVPHKQTNINAFLQSENVGIEFGERNKVGKSYLKKQYLKYYAKSLELKYHSTEFYDTYIKGTDVCKYLIDDKLIRIETTIKNTAHWNTYSLKIATLNDLLSLDLELHSKVFKRPINHYMSGKKFIHMKTKLTPTEKKDLKLINMFMEFYDLTESEAINHLVDEILPKEFSDPSNRNRYTKKLTELVENNREIKIVFKNKKQLDIISELEKINLVPKSE